MKPPVTSSGKIPPAVSFAVLSIVLLPVVWIAAQLVYGTAILSMAVYVCITVAAGIGLGQHYTHPSLGACNVITMLRAAIISVMSGAIIFPEVAIQSGWAFCAVAALVFSLDGLDGWLARRTGLSSSFGARFDMETDALLGAVLALVAVQIGITPAVLLLGFMRYLFVLAACVWPWLSAPLPDNMRRKTVCVIQIAALIFVLVPGLPLFVANAVIFGATALLIWSFATDIADLRRRMA